MEYCTKCGEALIPGIKYCSKCGALVTTNRLSPAVPIPTTEIPTQPVTSSTQVDEYMKTSVNNAIDSSPPAQPTTSTDSIISSANRRNLNIGEKIFTIVIVLLFAGVLASVATASVALVSTFVGDPFRLKPMFKGWGVNLWDESLVTIPTTPTSIPISTPSPSPAMVPATTQPPASGLTARPQGKIRINISLKGVIDKDPTRNQIRIYEAYRSNLGSVQDTWNKVLFQKDDFPSCELILSTNLDFQGRASGTKIIANKNTPKSLSDSAINSIDSTTFGTGKPAKLEIKFIFTKSTLK